MWQPKLKFHWPSPEFCLVWLREAPQPSGFAIISLKAMSHWKILWAMNQTGLSLSNTWWASLFFWLAVHSFLFIHGPNRFPMFQKQHLFSTTTRCTGWFQWWNLTCWNCPKTSLVVELFKSAGPRRAGSHRPQKWTKRWRVCWVSWGEDSLVVFLTLCELFSCERLKITTRLALMMCKCPIYLRNAWTLQSFVDAKVGV